MRFVGRLCYRHLLKAWRAQVLGGMAWLRLIGPLMLGLILASTDWGQFASVISCMALGPAALWFGLAAVSFLALLFLRVLRFSCLLVTQIGIRRGALLNATAQAALLGMVTPGRLGDIGRVWILEPYGIGKGEGTAVWLCERGLDVASLLSLGGASAIILACGYDAWWLLLCSYLGLLVATTAGGLATGRYLGSLATTHGSAWGSRLGFIRASSTWIGAAMVWHWRPVALTAISQALGCLGFYSVVSAISPGIAASHLLAAYAVSSTAAILPVSVGGVGVREAGSIAVLGAFGVRSEVALAASLLDGLLIPGVLLAVVVGGTRLGGQNVRKQNVEVGK